ncbi:MAG: hypothetical protein AMXMBFR22_03610 [Phycisphaerae bacterium]
MKRKRHTPEQVIRKLREADAALFFVSRVVSAPPPLLQPRFSADPSPPAAGPPPIVSRICVSA